VTDQPVLDRPTPSPARARPRTETRRLPAYTRLRRTLLPRERWLQLLLLVAVLGAWEWYGRRASNFEFAPPSEIVNAAREMAADGELQHAVSTSLQALLIGFALAAVVGIGVGFAMGWWVTLGRTLDPFVSAMYAFPIAALVPAMIIWFGLDLQARVIVIFLFAVFEILLTAYAGVRNVDPYVIDVARTFGAKRRDLVRKVVFPATLPFLFSGLRIGMSRAIKGMIVAEMLFAVTGIGLLIIENASAFQMDKVLAAALTVAVIGVALTGVLQLIERRVMRWRSESR
jgi:ABC-type nitrate/sulfonate/bicarbonate transport system permease component